MKYILFFLLLITLRLSAQFDTLIFHKGGISFRYEAKNVITLGDQNNDKCDDFLAYDCFKYIVRIFFGGNPIDTTPKFMFNLKIRDMVSLDINNDGYKDIVFTTYENYNDPPTMKIFYGGAQLDTIPDIIFHSPKGTQLNWMYVLNEFNGDGRSELLFYDSNVPFTKTYKQNGNFYFYNTEAVFDTIPHYVIRGDTTISEQLSYLYYSSGDINGDGKTDFTIFGYFDSGKPSYNPFRKIYLGNKDFNLTPAVTYYQNQHKFNVEYWTILKDVNGDGKDDFLIRDYGNYAPEVGYGILYGSFPVDTIPKRAVSGQNQAIDLQSIISGRFNGDKYNDFYTRIQPGGYGQVKIWLGGHEMDQYTYETWGGDEEGFCRGISEVGDVNGDGADDICLLSMQFFCDGPPDCACTSGGIYILKGNKYFQNDTTIVGVYEKINVKPNGYFLSEPYPNPFNPEVVIKYSLEESSKITIKIFDITGKLITELLNEERQKGTYEIKFDANKYSLSSGVYIVEMKAYKNGNVVVYSQSRKLSLLK